MVDTWEEEEGGGEEGGEGEYCKGRGWCGHEGEVSNEEVWEGLEIKRKVITKEGGSMAMREKKEDWEGHELQRRVHNPHIHTYTSYL